MSVRKIDIYNHVMPRAVADLMQELAPSMTGMVKRVTSIPMLHDIEARIRMMETWPGYQQVLTISNPPLEAIAGPGDSPLSPGSPMTNSSASATPGPTNSLPGLPRCRSTTSRRRSLRWIVPSPKGCGASRYSPMSTARRSTIRRSSRSSSVRPTIIASEFGCTQHAMLVTPTIRARPNQNTRFGKFSAGLMRPASQWRASSFPASSTDCRN